MEDTHTSTCSGGGYTGLKGLVLVLCLAGLQSATVLTTDKEKSPDAGALEVLVLGPDYAMVGVPITFECVANCSLSNCTYSMAVGNQVPGQGNELSFTIEKWMNTTTVTCTVKDDNSGFTGATTKTLHVLAGPVNISILASPASNNTYSCQAYCRPACNYTWKVDGGQWQGGLGNVVTVSEAPEVITCKASNSVSGLFISATWRATFGPSDIKIKGPNYIEMQTKSRLLCVAQCFPPCRYLWHMGNKTVSGNVIEVTVDHPVKSLNLTCEAQNTVSGRSDTIEKTLQLAAHSTATHDRLSALLLCALLFSAVISL